MIFNEKLLSGIHPSVVLYVKQLEKNVKENMGGNLYITEGYRSNLIQRAYYAQGRNDINTVNRLRREAGLSEISEPFNKIITNAKEGQSAHNWYSAVDLYYNDGSKTYIAQSPSKIFYDIMLKTESDYNNSELAKKYGKVYLGYHFGDYPHVEYANYRTLIGFQNRPFDELVKASVRDNLNIDGFFEILSIAIKVSILVWLITKKYKIKIL